MNDNLISLFLLFVGGAIGMYLGNRFSLLKSKSKSIKLETDIENKNDENLKLENKIRALLSDLELMRTEKEDRKSVV